MVQASDVWGFGPKAVVGPDRSGSMGEAAAKERGLVDVDVNAPTLGDFIVELDGRQLAGRTVDTADVVQRDGQPRREPNVRVRFSKPGLTARLLHAVTSPAPAYVLLMVALLLFVFELYTAGVGVAGVTGVLAMIPAAHGLAALPTRPSSLALIGLGVLGYTIDLQAGSPRTWTVIGTVALAVGSVRLYDGFAVPLPVLGLVLAGTALAMVAGMPAMLRTRFATPTIGRESMIGRDGVAVGSVDPEGTVEVDGAPWPARTNRATPIGPGDPVRVVAIDGLLLEVEPETGAARDYRR
jgi:membrane-bound serine protease (ClpP class)